MHVQPYVQTSPTSPPNTTPHHIILHLTTLDNERVVGFSYTTLLFKRCYVHHLHLCPPFTFVLTGEILSFLPPTHSHTHSHIHILSLFCFVYYFKQQHHTTHHHSFIIVHKTVLPSSCAFLHKSHFYATQNTIEN